MENNIELINKVLEEIKPLREEKTFLDLKLFTEKRKYNENPSQENLNKKNNIESEISEINNKLNPLVQKMRELKTLYLVEYEGEFTNLKDNSKYWEKYKTYLYLKNDVEINTFENPMDFINRTNNFSNLINEVSEYIYLTHFTHYNILNIKKISG